jgi:hypothetical protein
MYQLKLINLNTGNVDKSFTRSTKVAASKLLFNLIRSNSRQFDVTVTKD